MPPKTKIAWSAKKIWSTEEELACIKKYLEYRSLLDTADKDAKKNYWAAIVNSTNAAGGLGSKPKTMVQCNQKISAISIRGPAKESKKVVHKTGSGRKPVLTEAEQYYMAHTTKSTKVHGIEGASDICTLTSSQSSQNQLQTKLNKFVKITKKEAALPNMDLSTKKDCAKGNKNDTLSKAATNEDILDDLVADEREEKLAAKLCQFKAAVNYFSEPMFDTEETVYIPSSKIPVSGNDVFVAETQDAHVNDAQYDPSQIIVPSSVPEEDENDDAHSEQLCDFNDETMVQFGSNPDLVEGPRISGQHKTMLFTNENNEPILLQAQDSVTSDEMLSEIAHFANNPILFGSNTREVESNDDSQATVDGTQESQVVSGTVNSSSQVKVSKVTSESSNASKRKTGTLKISELGSQQSQEKDDSRYPGYIPILDEEITAQLVEDFDKNLEAYSSVHVEAIVTGIRMKDPAERQRHFKKTLNNVIEATTTSMFIVDLLKRERDWMLRLKTMPTTYDLSSEEITDFNMYMCQKIAEDMNWHPCLQAMYKRRIPTDDRYALFLKLDKTSKCPKKRKDNKEADGVTVAKKKKVGRPRKQIEQPIETGDSFNLELNDEDEVTQDEGLDNEVDDNVQPFINDEDQAQNAQQNRPGGHLHENIIRPGNGRAWTDLMIRRNQIQYLSTETKRCDSQMATMERMIEQQNADELRAKRQEDRLLAEHELRVRVLRIQEEFYKMQIDKMRSSGGKATGGGDSMDLEQI